MVQQYNGGAYYVEGFLLYIYIYIYLYIYFFNIFFPLDNTHTPSKGSGEGRQIYPSTLRVRVSGGTISNYLTLLMCSTVNVLYSVSQCIYTTRTDITIISGYQDRRKRNDLILLITISALGL